MVHIMAPKIVLYASQNSIIFLSPSTSSKDPTRFYEKQPTVVMVPRSDSFQCIRRKVNGPIFPLFCSKTGEMRRYFQWEATYITRTCKSINSFLNLNQVVSQLTHSWFSTNQLLFSKYLITNYAWGL